MDIEKVREEVHEEVERMWSEELLDFRKFLKTYPTPEAAARRVSSLDHDPMCEGEWAVPTEAIDKD